MRIVLSFLLFCLLVIGCERQEEPPPAGPEKVTEIYLSVLKRFLYIDIFFEQYSELRREKKNFKLPEGNINDLETWLFRREKEYKKEGADYYSVYFKGMLSQIERLLYRKKSGEFDLRDRWGQKLVYQCPADDPLYVFRFYSVGANGIDEKGSGDDIDRSLKYDEVKSYFEDPKFDGNTYRKYSNDLKLISDQKKGSLIHHP